MKIRPILVVAGLFGLVTGPALAQWNNTGPYVGFQVQQMVTTDVVREITPGVELPGAPIVPVEAGAILEITTEYEPKAGFTAAFGYDFGAFRTEAEFLWSQSIPERATVAYSDALKAAFDAANITPAASPAATIVVNEEASFFSVMGNVLGDLEFGSGLSILFGAGAGYSRYSGGYTVTIAEGELFDDGNSVKSPETKVVFNPEETAESAEFAYQFLLGASYRLSDSSRFDVGYRLYNTTVDGDDFQVHGANIGVRIAL